LARFSSSTCRSSDGQESLLIDREPRYILKDIALVSAAFAQGEQQ
jgi:hypothetical protein